MYVQFILGLTRLLILSVGMKILIYDSDPDFIEYAKPKSKVKVSVFVQCVHLQAS